MQDTILILAPQNDAHAIAVARMLESLFDLPSVIWDLSGIPIEDAVSFYLSEGSTNFQIKSSHDNFDLDSFHSIWWRRPGKFKLDDSVTDAKIREFCWRECETLFKGALEASNVTIVNHPTAQLAASRKPLQLALAQKVGLTIPKTLMSNDAEKIRAFWQKLAGNCIYKAFTPPDGRLVETRTLTEEDLKDLDKLRHAPIIVQEKIEKGLDVRVNIFGEKVFASSVKTNIAAAELDWRLDISCTWQEHILPTEVSQQLILLLRKLGLHYGCIDLRQQPNGTYVFLEVNPAGQFLFIEIETGQPVTRAFAELLVQPDVIMNN